MLGLNLNRLRVANDFRVRVAYIHPWTCSTVRQGFCCTGTGPGTTILNILASRRLLEYVHVNVSVTYDIVSPLTIGQCLSQLRHSSTPRVHVNSITGSWIYCTCILEYQSTAQPIDAWCCVLCVVCCAGCTYRYPSMWPSCSCILSTDRKSKEVQEKDREDNKRYVKERTHRSAVVFEYYSVRRSWPQEKRVAHHYALARTPGEKRERVRKYHNSNSLSILG